MHRDMICPAGTTCLSGRQHPPDLLSDACIAGHYCLPGDLDPNPRPCPEGTFSPLTGLKAVNECQSCPAGSYCSPSGRTEPVNLIPSFGHLDSNRNSLCLNLEFFGDWHLNIVLNFMMQSVISLQLVPTIFFNLDVFVKI